MEYRRFQRRFRIFHGETFDEPSARMAFATIKPDRIAPSMEALAV
jgi:hypothetical protein